MKAIINKGTQDIIKVQNENVHKLMFKFASDGLITINSLKDVDVKISILKNGKIDSILFDTTLFLLVQNQVTQNSQVYSLIQASSTFFLNLGTIYNLKDSQELQIEIKNKMFNIDPQTSTITLETVQGMGIQDSVVLFEAINLESTKLEQNINLGSNVQSVVIYDYAQSDDLEIKNARITSDKLNFETNQDLLSEAMFTKTHFDFSAFSHNLPFHILSTRLPLNDLQIRLNLKTNLSDCRLLVTRKVMTKEIVSNLVRKTEQHNRENISHIKQVSKSDCSC